MNKIFFTLLYPKVADVGGTRSEVWEQKLEFRESDFSKFEKSECVPKLPIFAQKSPIFAQKSPIFGQKSKHSRLTS